MDIQTTLFEDAAMAAKGHIDPIPDGDGEIEQASLELAALQDDPGNVSDDGSTSSRRSREASAAMPAQEKKKHKKSSKPKKGKSRITKGDGRMPLGYDPALLPTLGDKIVAHKAGRKGQAKANATPLALLLVAEQKKQEAEARAERRKELLQLFEARMASLAFKGRRRRTTSCLQLSSLDGLPTSPSHRRARSSEAVMTSLTQAVRRALPTVAKEGDSEGIDGTSAREQEGHEQGPSTAVPEPEEMEEVGNKANNPLDVIVSTDQPIKLAINSNRGLVSPRGCASPTTNLASSEDMVRQASSSGATEQAPVMEEKEGAGEDDLQEQEGALDVSQEEGATQQEELPASLAEMSDTTDSVVVEKAEEEVKDDVPQEQEGAGDVAQEEEGATQQEELPASSVDMSDTTDSVVVEKEGEDEVEVKDDVPQEREDTAPRSVKEKVVEMLSHITDACSNIFKTVAATACTAWACFCGSCSTVAEATLSVCQGVYETVRAWTTSA